jgi:hypothetical protein
MKAANLKVGKTYTTPSNLGGSYSVKYKGKKGSKHVFRVTNKDHEQDISGDDDWVEKNIKDDVSMKVTKKALTDAVSQSKLKEYDKLIEWGTEKKLPFSQGYAIKQAIKEFKIPAIEWGYGQIGRYSLIGVGTKKQRLFWKDTGTQLEPLGILNKDGSIPDSVEISTINKPDMKVKRKDITDAVFKSIGSGANAKFVATLETEELDLIENALITAKNKNIFTGSDKTLLANILKKINSIATGSPSQDAEGSSGGRTTSEAIGPYKKGSMVVKKKGKKEPITGDSEDHSDAKMYGKLTPKEAGVLLDIYEDNGRFTDTKNAESLVKKKYITVSKAPSGRTPGEGQLTKLGEQWYKDFQAGKFDSELIVFDKNMGMLGGTHFSINEDTGRFEMRQGSETVVISKPWMKKVIKLMQTAADQM